MATLDVKQIPWHDSRSIFLTPTGVAEPTFSFDLIKKWPDHFWLTTSGSYSVERSWVGLSKAAILASAQAVNEHLQVSSQDVWLNALPLYHVGGLGIHARAFLARIPSHDISDKKWEPYFFCRLLNELSITLTSVVPTQVFDLINQQLQAPPQLRAVLVGGGRLADHLYLQARELGWPLLTSYGLTECSSQVATAPLSSLSQLKTPLLEVLSHVHTRLSPEGVLEIKSPALLTVKMNYNQEKWEEQKPTPEGWWPTADRVVLEEISNIKMLTHLGRETDQIKIAGELINLTSLQEIVQKIAQSLNLGEFCPLVLASPNERWGHEINLAAQNPSEDQEISAKLQPLIKRYQEQVIGLARIRKLHLLKQIPKTELGKVAMAQLYKQIDLGHHSVLGVD